MRIEYENDIVFARFIRYMDKALLHRKINYLKHQEYLLKKEKQLTYEEWVVVPNKEHNTHSFCFAKMEDFGELNKLIEKLTKKQKKVIYLSYFENKTNKKIAESMNVTEKAVEALKTRALKKMREELEKRNNDGVI